jgi:hypothetical protein
MGMPSDITRTIAIKAKIVSARPIIVTSQRDLTQNLRAVAGAPPEH